MNFSNRKKELKCHLLLTMSHIGYLAVSGSRKLISVTIQTRHNPVIAAGSQDEHLLLKSKSFSLSIEGGKNLVMHIWDTNSPFFYGTSTTAGSWWNLYWSSDGNGSLLIEGGCVCQRGHHGRVSYISPSQLSGANHDVFCPSLQDALQAPCVLSPHGPSPAKLQGTDRRSRCCSSATRAETHVLYHVMRVA